MAADIAPAMLERVRASFESALASDKRAAELLARLESGKGTYAEAQEYAGRAGAALASALRENVSSDGLPDGRMYYNIADRVLRPMLDLDWDYVSAAAQQAQANINAANGIGMQAVRPAADADRIQGLVDEASNAEHYDDAAPRLYDQIDNLGRHAVDETVRRNAELHEKAGLSPKVVRTAAPDCCKWCAEQAGTYDYAKIRGTGNDVWRRHTNCNCLIEYDVGDGRRSAVNNYRWSEHRDPDTGKRVRDMSDEEISRRIKMSHSLTSDADPARIAERKAVAAPDDRQGVRDVAAEDERLSMSRSEEYAARIAEHPRMLGAYTPEGFKETLERVGFEVKPLGKGAFQGVPFEDGGGFRVNFADGGLIQYHPAERSHHGGAYYKISTGKGGIHWYDTDGKEKSV